MPPAAIPIAAAVAPVVAQQFLNRPSSQQRQALDNQNRASSAQAAEIERSTGLSREMTEFLMGILNNPQGMNFESLDIGSQLGLNKDFVPQSFFEAIAPGMQQKTALDQLLGLTGTQSGTGVLNSAAIDANRAQEQRGQENSQAVATLMQQLLSQASKPLGPGTGGRQLPPVSDPIQDIFDDLPPLPPGF